MTRIFDSFMFGRELDMLECRLVELEPVKNLVHVIVEARVDHQDHPKPLYFAEHRERFAPWADRIVHVVADRFRGPYETRRERLVWRRQKAHQPGTAEGSHQVEGREGHLSRTERSGSIM